MAETPTTSTAGPEEGEPEPSAAPGRLSQLGKIRTSKFARAGWTVYQQIAAVFAAFGIAAVIGHWWRIGWRGWLEAMVGVWGRHRQTGDDMGALLRRYRTLRMVRR